MTGTTTANTALTTVISVARPTYLASTTALSLTTQFASSVNQGGNTAKAPAGCPSIMWMCWGSNCAEVDSTAHTGSLTSTLCPHAAWGHSMGSMVSGYNSALVLNQSSVYQFQVHGGSSPYHPWHMHVNHFQ